MRNPPRIFLLALCSLLLPAFSASPRLPAVDEPAIILRITTTVNADGSGALRMEIVLDKGILGILRSFPDFPQAGVCNGFSSGIEGFPEMAESEGDGSIICAASKTFPDLEGLKAITEDSFKAGTFQRLEIDGGRFFYDLAADIDSALTWDVELPFGIIAWWIVNVPGDVVDTNADTVRGRTLSWDLMTMNSASHVRAESEVGGGEPDPTLLAVGGVVILGCGCVVVLIAAVAGFFLFRKKQPPSRPLGRSG